MRYIICVMCVYFTLCAPVYAEKRIALIIGNSAYENTRVFPRLDNPVNDATDIAAALKRLNFGVTLKNDLSVSQFDNILRVFVDEATNADIAFFFYAGHGLQIDKRGFMVPVDAKGETESSAFRELAAIQDVVDRIERKAKTSVIVLDACRDSPLQERLRGGKRTSDSQSGLPRLSRVGSNTLVVYATVPGETAKDGEGRNSPFTKSLLKHIEQPGLEIEQMFKLVTADVRQATDGKQRPERLSSLEANLFLHAASTSPESIVPKKAARYPTQEEQAARELMPIHDGNASMHIVLPVASNAPKSGETFRDCSQCPEMVVVPPGSFMMGSLKDEKAREHDEGPQHRVTIATPLAVGKFDVTFDEWQICVDDGGCQSNKMPSDHGWGRGQHPVINVSWEDAREYTSWLSRKVNKKYRLLSEAEWEYAARAGTATYYFWGNDIGRNHANCDGCGSKWDSNQTAPVGSFPPNAFNLYDMHGNVWQWVEDCWHERYKGKPAALKSTGAAWASNDCTSHGLRGGSWYGNQDGLRSANRFKGKADTRNNVSGFRVARTL